MIMTTTMLVVLSLLVNDGVAFTNELPVSRAGKRNHLNIPFRKMPTSLSYKNDGGETNSKQDLFTLSKRTKIRPSKKKFKAKKPSNRSYQLHKKGMPATEEELVYHLQSVFSDLKEFDSAKKDEDEPCILSEPGAEGGSSPSPGATQLQSCKKLDRHPALVLNADYQPLKMLPLSIWSWQDTVKAVLSGKAVVVDIYPAVFVRAVNLDMPVPSVIALREYAHTGKVNPAFTRRNVYLRDGYRCQYCSGLFHTADLSLDHVEPRCFGGKLTWDNTVTCCRKCNCRKGHLRTSEIHRVGMQLQTQPRCPSLFELAAEATKFVPRRVHTTWAPFLGLSTTEEEDGQCSTVQ